MQCVAINKDRTPYVPVATSRHKTIGVLLHKRDLQEVKARINKLNDKYTANLCYTDTDAGYGDYDLGYEFTGE